VSLAANDGRPRRWRTDDLHPTIPLGNYGVNRTSISAAAQLMQKRGAYRLSPRNDQVKNRAGLESASCECCGIDKRRFDAFLIPSPNAVRVQGKGRLTTA